MSSSIQGVHSQAHPAPSTASIQKPEDTAPSVSSLLARVDGAASSLSTFYDEAKKQASQLQLLSEASGRVVDLTKERSKLVGRIDALQSTVLERNTTLRANKQRLEAIRAEEEKWAVPGRSLKRFQQTKEALEGAVKKAQDDISSHVSKAASLSFTDTGLTKESLEDSSSTEVDLATLYERLHSSVERFQVFCRMTKEKAPDFKMLTEVSAKLADLGKEKSDLVEAVETWEKKEPKYSEKISAKRRRLFEIDTELPQLATADRTRKRFDAMRKEAEGDFAAAQSSLAEHFEMTATVLDKAITPLPKAGSKRERS